MNTNPALDSILDEVITWSSPDTLAEGEFTVEDYIARYKATRGITLSDGAARDRLNRQAKEGKLTKRLVAKGATRVNAYRILSSSMPEREEG